MKRILLIFAVLTQVLSGMAQQEQMSSLSFFSRLPINPAYAGSRGQFSVLTLARRQWIGFENAPRTETVTAHMPSADGRNGFGLSVITDKNAFTSRASLAGSYAYRIPVGESGHLALGMQMGLQSYRLRTSEIDVWDQGDPSFDHTMGDFSKWMMIAGPGIYFSNTHFYLGASIPDILPHRLYDPYYEPLIAKSNWHHHVMGGALLNLGTAIKFKPNFLLRAVKGAPLSLDLNGSFVIKDMVCVGSSWRPDNAVVFNTELYLFRGLRLGYAYDLPLGLMRSLSTGSHELMLGVDMSLFKRGEDIPEQVFIN